MITYTIRSKMAGKTVYLSALASPAWMAKLVGNNAPFEGVIAWAWTLRRSEALGFSVRVLAETIAALSDPLAGHEKLEHPFAVEEYHGPDAN